MRFLFVFLLFLFPLLIRAESWTVRSNQVPLFAEPNFESKVVGRVDAQRTIVTEGRPVEGFLKVKTRSGRPVYIRVDDLEPKDVSRDLVHTEEEEPPQSLRDYPIFTYDLGFSAGSYSGRNYSEFNFGLNTFFRDWIAWRNALFARFVEPENIYGLDSSGRLYWRPEIGPFGFTAFGGPGFRFVSKGSNLPFGEAGLILRLGGFSLGGGVKVLFNSLVDSRLTNDTSYFVILSGGGQL